MSQIVNGAMFAGQSIGLRNRLQKISGRSQVSGFLSEQKSAILMRLETGTTSIHFVMGRRNSSGADDS